MRGNDNKISEAQAAEYMADNYYETTTDKVSQLLHFPFEDYKSFKDAAANDRIQVGIAQDIARQWVSTGEYSKFYAFLVTILLLGYFAPAIALLIGAVAIGNLWYLLLIPIALFLGFTTFSPVSAKIGGNSILFLYFLIIVIAAFLLPNGISALAWVPLAIGLMCVRVGYKLAYKITMRQIFFNERLLCRLWKFGNLSIRDNGGVVYSQRYKEVGKDYTDYKDIGRMWKEYYKSNSANNETHDLQDNSDELGDWDTIKNK